MIQLISRWGKEIDPGNILQEYPRPNLVRDSYFNLNGEWECRINESETADFYDETIIVPFSPESMLSGVGKIVMPHQRLHYRKKFTLPEGFKKSRVLLHFGAVDQECSVFVNGIRMGGHKGGYLPFHFDITDSLRQGENVLTLSVTDRTEQSPHARGKQKLQKKGKYASLFYTPQSGIWKTVWMESVEKAYIEDVRITPLYDDSSVRFEITVLNACKTSGAEASGGKASGGETSGTVRLAVLERGVEIGQAEITVRQAKEIKQVISQEIKLDGFKPWTPDTPHLYDVIIRYGEDEVRSYFGMRKLSTGRDGKGILRFFLNNKPYFFNGILDQGYWPESLMTAPSDEALVYDIIKLKEMGYNTIRKHVKIEAERFYYHCDRLGMMVWQDMPNGGGEYNMVFVTHLPNASDRFARGVSDRHYGIFKRKDGEGRRQYYTDLKNMVSTLYNYPSIAVWVPFNEGWGQFDAAKATKEVREIDSGRLINEACGWFDQGGGDMYSIHNYRHKLKVKPQQDRVVALTEYGGYAYPVEEHLSCKKEFGYQHYHSTEELTQNYKRLWEEEIYPNLQYGLCSAIYTQTSDIEEEINGVLTYDREIDKLDVGEVRELNQRLYDLFDSLV